MVCANEPIMLEKTNRDTKIVKTIESRTLKVGLEIDEIEGDAKCTNGRRWSVGYSIMSGRKYKFEILVTQFAFWDTVIKEEDHRK